MNPNRSIPQATVIPILIYPDVRQAVDWLSRAFGFSERVQIGENHRSQLRVGDGAVIIGEVQSTTDRMVTMRSMIGANRIVDMISGEQLPRIC